MIPQLIFLALMIMGLGVALAKDGEPRDGHHSFFISLVVTSISAGLLWWGGFFDVLTR